MQLFQLICLNTGETLARTKPTDLQQICNRSVLQKTDYVFSL